MNESRGWYSRGYVPHFDSPERVQHVVFRTFDSLPRSMQVSTDAPTRERLRAFEEILDAGEGSRPLATASAAKIVEAALLHFDGERYRLLAWCVMPNHVHVVFEQIDGFALADVVRNWKSYTALVINRAAGLHGRLWARDYFDRYMRDEARLVRTIDYVENNPVKARLTARPEDWPFSSARTRG